MIIDKNKFPAVVTPKSLRVKKYTGALTAKKIADGINIAYFNGRRLLNSAELLFAAKDYAGAVSLAVLAVEEVGKAGFLRVLALEADEKAIKNCWKNYRTHTKKNIALSAAAILHPGKIGLKDLDALFEEDNPFPRQWDDLKQLGFYSECLGDDGHWHVPSLYYKKKDAKAVLNHAQQCCYRSRDISVREIELWIECMKPVWRKSMEEMKQGLILWRKKMQEENLIPADNRFEEFVTSGINLGGSK